MAERGKVAGKQAKVLTNGKLLLAVCQAIANAPVRIAAQKRAMQEGIALPI